MVFGMSNILWWPFIAAFGAAAIIVAVLIVIFWIWMLIDCANRKFKNDVEKILWIVIIVIGGWLGALVYLIVIRSSNPRGLAKS